MRLTALLALVALSACGPRTVRVVMLDQNNSGQKGYADIIENGTQVDIKIFVTASLVDETQPCHVHTGRCGEVGPMQVPLDVVKPPNPGDATAESLNTAKDISFDEITDGNHVINVHDSRDTALYVSCGNI